MSKIHSSKRYTENVYKKLLLEKGLFYRYENQKKGYSERIKEENGGETGEKKSRRPYVC